MLYKITVKMYMKIFQLKKILFIRQGLLMNIIFKKWKKKEKKQQLHCNDFDQMLTTTFLVYLQQRWWSLALLWSSFPSDNATRQQLRVRHHLVRLHITALIKKPAQSSPNQASLTSVTNQREHVRCWLILVISIYVGFVLFSLLIEFCFFNL